MGPSGLKGAFYQERLILFDENELERKTQHSFSLEMIASQVFLYEIAANFSYSFLKRFLLGPVGCKKMIILTSTFIKSGAKFFSLMRNC